MVSETGVILNNEMNGKEPLPKDGCSNMPDDCSPRLLHTEHLQCVWLVGYLAYCFGLPIEMCCSYPSPANYVRPRKRPLTSIAPMMVEFANGSLFSVLGASGGSRIITTVVQNGLHLLNGKMSVAEALACPRLHDQLIPNRVVFETGFKNSTVGYMKDMGHNVSWGSAGSSAQAITITGGTFEAAGEPRQKNSAGITT